MMTDPIADMLTQMRNSLQAEMTGLIFLQVKLRLVFVKCLKQEGYIKSFKILSKGMGFRLKVLFNSEAIVGIKDFQSLV